MRLINATGNKSDIIAFQGGGGGGGAGGAGVLITISLC